jgi:DNA ligase-1
MSLERLQSLVNSLNKSNSNNDKINTLREYSDCEKYLSYTYDTIRYQYGVTSSNVISKEPTLKSVAEGTNISFDGSIDSLLTNLSNRTFTGNNAIVAVLQCIYKQPEYRNLILNIIDRNLETRIGISTINKVFPGCISEFSVALANSLSDYDPNRTKIDFENNEYIVERKLDGVRTIALIDGDGNVTFKSRNGKIYDTLGVIEDQIKSIGLKNVVLDGECCLLNSDGTDNLQGMMKEIRRKNHTIQNAAYRCFDMLPLDKFYSKKYDVNYSTRYSYLRQLINGRNLSNVGVIDAWVVKSWKDVDQLQKMAIQNNWEGLMLRKNTIYKGDRSNDLLKIKQFAEREYVVNDIEIGPFRVINYDPSGKAYEATENIVTTIFITHEGNRVGVGSGMSIDMRRLWTKDPSLIKGKTITVKYFEETVDKNGNKSLRFPTLKTIHGIERTT